MELKEQHGNSISQIEIANFKGLNWCVMISSGPALKS